MLLVPFRILPPFLTYRLESHRTRTGQEGTLFFLSDTSLLPFFRSLFVFVSFSFFLPFFPCVPRVSPFLLLSFAHSPFFLPLPPLSVSIYISVYPFISLGLHRPRFPTSSCFFLLSAFPFPHFPSSRTFLYAHLSLFCFLLSLYLAPYLALSASPVPSFSLTVCSVFFFCSSPISRLAGYRYYWAGPIY